MILISVIILIFSYIYCNFTLLHFPSLHFTLLYFSALSGSSTVHLMPLLISITRLFFHSAKPEKVVKPYMGIIFLEYLKDYFGLKRGIEVEDDVKSLCDISNHLVAVRRRFIDKEHVIQEFGYLLLTIYSSDQLNCDILEDNFYFLSLLLASLPALDGWDSISAVLTTLNYVCQCIDSETEMPIVALCAAMTVMSRTALYGDSTAVRDRAFQQLDATCSSFEAIVRGQPQYAQIILKSGMLKWVLCDTLRGVLHVQMLPLYLRVVDFVTSVVKKGPPDVMTVQQSGLLPLFYSILSPDNNSNNDNNNNNSNYNNNYDSNNKDNNDYSDAPKELMEQLLKLLEELVKAEPLHLEEIFKGIIRLLDVLIISRISQAQGSRSLNKSAEKKSNEKIILLCNSLGRIIKREKEAIIVWRELNGFQWLIVYMGRLEGSFSSLPGLPESGSFTAFSSAKFSTSSASLSSSASSSLDSSSRRNMSSSSSGSNSNRSSGRDRDRDRDSEITHTPCASMDDPAGVVSVINALMSCIAIDMLVSSPYDKDKKSKDFELNRAGARYNNAHLTDALLSTNIFSSAYAEYGLHALFGLVTGRVDQITNDTLFSVTMADGTSARPATSSSLSATSTSFSTSSASSSSKIASGFNPNSSFSSSSMLSYVYDSKSSKGSILVPHAAEIIADMLLWLPSSIGLRAIQILNDLSVCSQDGKYRNMYVHTYIRMYACMLYFYFSCSYK